MARRTRAATRAAAAAAEADALERALDVCLQQPAFRQEDSGRVAISVRRVSKLLAALVAGRCRGALAVRAMVDRPVRAYALAAWLTHHGGLLAELDLNMHITYAWRAEWQAAAAAPQRRQQHPTARLLEQLPASLTRLVVSTVIISDDKVAAQQAVAFAAVLSRQSMQLRSLELPHSWSSYAAILLPALSQLRQLTSLVALVPLNISQLPVQHVPAQLQQLSLHSGRDQSSAGLPWLALEHVTGLTSLSMDRLEVDGGVLPCGLRALTVADFSDVAPVLQLVQLTALQLLQCRAAAEQLQQLSRLARLEQLSLTLTGKRTTCDAAASLPLVHLNAHGQELTAACLDNLAARSALTQLQLGSCSLVAGATLAQLASMLGRLTALEHLTCGSIYSQPAAVDADWAPVCQAVARLPRLSACDLSGAKLGQVAAAQLAAATQLTELRVHGCGLDDAGVSVLCNGLTGLRRLDLACKNHAGDGCLEAIAALRRLSWLNVRHTPLTRRGVDQLRAVRTCLHVEG